ncbi:unnamed protein product [Pleuronectes platessa]|uniref:Uncharacterized protein n=1 Tax=Pleuronectes platessa TaxID=8262 RepID=A0A9N7YCS8_PLEPL|nr:unnamed protein product [Pleuronectes platessa]
MANNGKANFFKGAATRSKLTSKTSPTPEPTSPTTSGDNKELKDAVESIQMRLGEEEQRIADVEDVNTWMEENMEKCHKRLETLWMRVEDLENRSRRNNHEEVKTVALSSRTETDRVFITSVLIEPVNTPVTVCGHCSEPPTERQREQLLVWPVVGSVAAAR